MPACCVLGCGSSQRNGTKSFMFPKMDHRTETFQKLSNQRRNAWLTALGQTASDPTSWEELQICNSHFISGKMAALQDVNNVDWVPTMNLRDPGDSKCEILRCSVEDCVVSTQGGQCSFYRISKDTASGKLKVISDEKLLVWKKALELNNEPATCESIYVCHAHYIIDMGAKLRDLSMKQTIDLDIVSTDKTTVSLTKLVPGKLLNNNNIPTQPDQFQVSSTSTKQKSYFSKSGNILRNENGQFSFTCDYCSAVNDDSHEMMNHINTHFGGFTPLNISVSRPPVPEFVSCTITHDDRKKSENSETFRELTNVMPEPEPPEKGVKFTTGVTKTELIPTPRRRSSSTIDVKDLIASRPCKIKRVQPTDEIDPTQKNESPVKPTKKLAKTRQTIGSPSAPVKFVPFPIPPLPVELGQKMKVAPERVNKNKNHENIKKNANATVFALAHSTYLEDFQKARITCNPDFQKCVQCKVEPIVGETEPRQHRCRECEESFPSHSAYRIHFLDNHADLTPKCYQCDMEPSVSNASDPRRHKCAICNYWLSNHTEYKVHLKDVHDENVTDNDFNYFANDCKRFSCYICEKSCKQREYLVYHVKGHFEKYLGSQCHLCGFKFRSDSVLRQHIIKQHDNTPTNCDVCDKFFPNKWKMRHHRMSHTTELNHICDICSKAFKLRKYLTRHMAVHNEAKLACRYCDATFTFSTGRRIHEKSVHRVL